MGKTKRIHREAANKRARRHVERCCECKRTWGLQNFVLGVGSCYSDIFCFPTQRAHVVMLCEECAQHHGPLEECISCVRQVIGPTLFGKCRLCLGENKIWKALENFGVADRLLHPDERGAALNGNKYSIFFDEYGKPLDEILQAIPPL